MVWLRNEQNIEDGHRMLQRGQCMPNKRLELPHIVTKLVRLLPFLLRELGHCKLSVRLKQLEQELWQQRELLQL